MQHPTLLPDGDPFAGHGLFETARDYYRSPRFTQVWECQQDVETAVRLLYFITLRLDSFPMTHVLSWCDQAVERSSYLVGKYSARLDDLKRRHKAAVAANRAPALQALVAGASVAGMPQSRLPEIARSDVADYVENMPEIAGLVAREAATKELVQLVEGLAEASKRRHASAVQVSVNERHEREDATR